jgi:cytochrome b6-f complex iron-sulfur subunit
MADPDAPAAGAAAPGSGGERRQFLKWLSGGFLSLWALGGAGALAAYLRPPDRNEASAERIVSIGRLDNLRVGEARLVQHGITPFYVLRTDASRVIALSAVCTHMRCILRYDRERHGLLCPCHEGRFDLNGNAISGPPQRALAVYEVSTRAGEVFVRV